MDYKKKKNFFSQNRVAPVQKYYAGHTTTLGSKIV